MKRPILSVIACLTLLFPIEAASADQVRVKDLGRFLGWRDNALVGYGIVIGLSGSGDSPRSEVTRQAVKNVLSRLGSNITVEQVESRNVAAVVVTAVLPPSSNIGDHIDITVSSIGDARSLAGGTLLMTPLAGPDQHNYALAQGSLVVGGYHFEANQNVKQKNYPTSGVVPNGATVEVPVGSSVVGERGDLTFILKDPDFTTAERIADGVNSGLGRNIARVRGADAVVIDSSAAGEDVFRLISQVENVTITPDGLARVVINERSGTVVAGAGVQISGVVVSQGDLRVSVSVENQASQPGGYGDQGSGVQSLIITNTKLSVSEPSKDAVVRFSNTTVGDLVEGLSRLHVNTRGVINILQAVKAAGALHADIVVQ